MGLDDKEMLPRPVAPSGVGLLLIVVTTKQGAVEAGEQPETLILRNQQTMLKLRHGNLRESLISPVSIKASE
jgi:hypothetical protein